MESGIGLTLQRRETTVHDQLEITQLALREHNSGESLGLSDELVLARSIAGNQVLEDTTVGSVGHCEYVCMKENKKTLFCEESPRYYTERKKSGGGIERRKISRLIMLTKLRRRTSPSDNHGLDSRQLWIRLESWLRRIIQPEA